MALNGCLDTVEAGQLLQALRIFAQANPGIVHDLVEGLQIGVDAVAEAALAQFVPQHLGQVEFRCGGRQMQQGFSGMCSA